MKLLIYLIIMFKISGSQFFYKTAIPLLLHLPVNDCPEDGVAAKSLVRKKDEILCHNENRLIDKTEICLLFSRIFIDLFLR